MSKQHCVKRSFSHLSVGLPVIMAMLLIMILMLGGYASADSNSLPGSLYTFEGPGLGAVHEDLPENVYTPVPGDDGAGLPNRVNLSTDKYFPPIRSQVGGSCVAWATTYYQFTYQAARLNNWDAKHDDSKVFSPKYTWNFYNSGQNIGVSASNCYKVLKDFGSLRWSEYPQTNLSYEWYQGTTESQTLSTLHNALKTRLSEYDYRNFATIQNQNTTSPVITSSQDSKLTHMKELLQSGHVLNIYTYVSSFYTDLLDNNQSNTSANGQRVCLYMNGNNGYHSMSVVGYDDTIHYDLNQNGVIEEYEKGAFLVANSWGTRYANNGYIWVMYDALNKVSNVSSLNMEGRQPLIEDNLYRYIEVSNYTPDLTAEITVQQKNRQDLSISLGRSDTVNSSKSRYTTFIDGLYGTNGAKGFDGVNSTYQSHTFVFDYESVYNGDKVYWVDIRDRSANNGAITTVQKIRWLNANGTVIKEIGQQPSLDGTTGSYHSQPVLVTGISLNKSSSTLGIGQSETLTATVTPSNAANKAVQWKTSNSSVVSVSSSGKVTAVNKGTASVWAVSTDGSNIISNYCNYTITDDFSDTFTGAHTISLHSQISGKIDVSGDLDFFKFTPTTSGTYIIYTTGSTDTKGVLYNSSQSQLIANDDASISGTNFAIKYNLTAGSTYYISVGAYSTRTGPYTLVITKGVYSASLASYNPDARRVQMQAEAASVLTKLDIHIGNRTYTLNKPASGALDTTIGSARFKVTFTTANNGLSTIWTINAKIPATTPGSTETVYFSFSKGTVTGVNSSSWIGFVAYESYMKTGIDPDSNLQAVLEGMSSSGYTLTVRNWDNTLVNTTSSTKAATGMKIIKTNTSTGKIVGIYYVVLFGDVTGSGNVGDGEITSSDSMVVLQYATDKITLIEILKLAADVNHDGIVDSSDALIVMQAATKKVIIDQDSLILEVPDECYYLDPVTF